MWFSATTCPGSQGHVVLEAPAPGRRSWKHKYLKPHNKTSAANISFPIWTSLLWETEAAARQVSGGRLLSNQLNSAPGFDDMQRLCQGDTWWTETGSAAVLLNDEKIEEAPSPHLSALLYFHNAKTFEPRKTKTFPFAQSPSQILQTEP